MTFKIIFLTYTKENKNVGFSPRVRGLSTSPVSKEVPVLGLGRVKSPGGIQRPGSQAPRVTYCPSDVIESADLNVLICDNRRTTVDANRRRGKV